MKKKTISVLALGATMLVSSVFGLVACKPAEPEKEPFVVDGALLTVNKAGKVRYEAEETDTAAYTISSDNETKIVERDDASGGKFLAAATGNVDASGSNYFRFTLNLQFNAEISMSAAYAQTESKKANDIDMTKSYNYLIDENYSVRLTENDNILYAREDVTDWETITYDTYTLPKGTHSFRVFVKENTGKGNPNIDYIEFDFTEVSEGEVEGVAVPENDFHTPVQYAYIHDENYRDVSPYAQGVIELSRPNAINLDYSYLGSSSSYAVEYADNASFTGSVVVKDIEAQQYGVYNLKLGQDLYWRAAKSEAELGGAKVNHMTIATDGPRNLYVEGVSNFRDIGGYESSLVDEARIRQGLYFRGANLENITDAGKAEMLRLGIKAEIDMRDSYQCNGPYVDGIAYYPASIPSGTESTRFEAFEDVYLKIFNLIAEADNNPIFLHCTAGADRTGISSFMLLTVCGASYEDIVRDYLFTNFSVQGVRKIESEFDNWWSKLDGFGKATKAENAKAWLMSKGVSEGTVEHIREIFVEGYEATVPYEPSTPSTPSTPETPVIKDPAVDAPAKNFTALQVTNAAATIAQAGYYRFEAESVQTGNWQISGDNASKVVGRTDASGGKFLAAASGNKVGIKENYVTFTLKLETDSKVTMTAAYVQTESKKANAQDVAKTFGYKLSSNEEMELKTKTVLQPRNTITLWDTFTYEPVLLRAGTYVITLYVKENTGMGVPNIDFFDFKVEDHEFPPPETPSLSIDKKETVRFEAEEADLTKWAIASIHNTAVVSKGDKDSKGADVVAANTASGDKFVAAATGGSDQANAGLWLEYKVNLMMNADVTLSAAYIQSQDKLAKTPDLSKNLTVTLGEQTLTINGNAVMAAATDGSKWVVYNYNTVSLKAGEYTFRLKINYDSTGMGNPNIDYFDFAVTDYQTVPHIVYAGASGDYTMEAENTISDNYQISGDNASKVVERADASGGKFLAAASGSKVGIDNNFVTFILKLDVDAKVTMTAAYAQTESKKANAQDVAKTFGYNIAGVGDLKLTSKTVLAARNDITQWETFTYDTLILKAGTYEVKLYVKENTGKGVPNIDYIKFNVVEATVTEGKIRVEAETADLGGNNANWKLAGGFDTAVQDSEGKASGDKFLAAATGGKDNLDGGKVYLTFKFTLEEGTLTQMKAAYAQIKDAVPNLTFTITIDGTEITTSQKMSNKGVGVWQEITYDAILLSAGEHTVKLVVNYDKNNQGNPSIDYFDFNILKAE